MRKIFIEDLPHGGAFNQPNRVNWKQSIGKTVHFIYDNIEGDINIIGYNSKNRNIIVQYKNNKPFEMGACSFRDCKLGNLLQNEFYYSYNEHNKRRVDLRCLPRYRNGINWSKSIGKQFYFHYDDIEGYIEIIKYKTKGQKITLKFKEKINTITTSDLLDCKIGNIIGKWNTDFVFKIGDIITTNYCIIEIIECFRKFEKSHNGYMKWYKFKCTTCGWDKGEIRENDLKKHTRGSCQKCGDGASYPNKIGFNLLEQLGLDFIHEYSPDWIKPKRYDFYFIYNNNKYIMEMDGMFHKIDNHLSGLKKDEIKKIDNYKDKLATENNINIIRIDCSFSNLDYIKNNILHSMLSELFNLDRIDWLKCHKYACSTKIKEACDLYMKNKNLNTKELGTLMKISDTTMCKYLKKGAILGWCDYDPKVARKIGINKYKNKGIYNATKVICLNTNDIFNSQAEAARKYNLNQSHIYKCIIGKRKTYGKHPETGEPLKWMYYKDYISKNLEDII